MIQRKLFLNFPLTSISINIFFLFEEVNIFVSVNEYKKLVIPSKTKEKTKHKWSQLYFSQQTQKKKKYICCISSILSQGIYTGFLGYAFFFSIHIQYSRISVTELNSSILTS